MALSTDYSIKPDTGITTTTAIMGKDASQMGMDEFFNLLVAQMTNQDMMDPQSNTEYISQMAQFASLQSMDKVADSVNAVTEYQLSSYAVSYVGKNVAIAHINEDGDLEKSSGTVSGVTFYDGAPQVVVNGKTYPLHEVMEVNVPGYSTSLSDAAQYIGKNVELYTENADGSAKKITGVVTSVAMMDDKPYVVIDGNKYPVSGIVGILEDTKPETGGTDGTGGTDDEDGTGAVDGTDGTGGTDTDDETETAPEDTTR